jgi:hypothetical protein
MRLPEYPSNFPSQQPTQATTQLPTTEPEQKSSASTSTLPLLETEFLPELGFGTNIGGGGAEMFDGIDWDALMNNGGLFDSIGGGWNDSIWDDQSLR